MKLYPIPADSSIIIKTCFLMTAELSTDRTLNTDGKSTCNCLRKDLTVCNVHVDNKDPNHRLRWLNIVIGNIQNHIIGIYHGITKRDLPLCFKHISYYFLICLGLEIILQ